MLQGGVGHCWEKLQGLSTLQILIQYLDEGSRDFDWTYVGDRTLAKISMNDIYNNIIVRHVWMKDKVIR